MISEMTQMMCRYMTTNYTEDNSTAKQDQKKWAGKASSHQPGDEHDEHKEIHNKDPDNNRYKGTHIEYLISTDN